jgi:HPt (histidine-containing phosphotransfer) domain-containing protein
VSHRIQVRVESELEVLIPRFLANRQREVISIEKLLTEQDFARVREIGHDMKGVGGGYGFERISQLGAAIEDAAKSANADRIASLVTEYRAYLHDVDIVYV